MVPWKQGPRDRLGVFTAKRRRTVGWMRRRGGSVGSEKLAKAWRCIMHIAREGNKTTEMVVVGRGSSPK